MNTTNNPVNISDETYDSLDELASFTRELADREDLETTLLKQELADLLEEEASLE